MIPLVPHRFVRDRPGRLKCRHFDDGWRAAPLLPLAKRQPKSERLRLSGLPSL